MKTFALIACLGLSLTAFAQERSTISRSVNDDGKTLHIKIDIESSERTVHYDRSFDATAMGKDEKQALVRQIQDSLGVHVVVQPPRPPRPARYESGEWTASNGKSTPGNVIVAPDGTSYKKTVVEDGENGRLKLRYEYKLDGEEHIFERTINLQGKTEADKQRIVADTERSLGLSSARK